MGVSPGIMPFPEWKPDITDLDTEASQNILNVIPRGDGYGPYPGPVAFTQTVGAACRGYFMARNADGSVSIFAATSTDLYELNNSNFTWTKVSLGGGPYSGLPSTDNWWFLQFNTQVLAGNINVAPQTFTLGSSSAFANLGGSPPQAAYAAIINRFVVLAGILNFPSRVQWSGLNALTTWDNVTSQSNFQDLADGGRTRGIAGGDQFGVIFQETSIRSMIFAPGSAVVFDILRIATNDGALSPGSIVSAGDQIFFCSPQGFKVIPPGGYPQAIGKEKIDRTFFADVDTANLQLFIASTDPTTTKVYWAYKSISGQANLFDKILVYDRALNKWTPLKVSGEYIATLSKPGLTLENLDAIAPGVITISGATNNGLGAIRLTISSLTAGTPPSNTNLNTENTVEVYGVNGTTEANGNWQFTIISSTQIDLKASTFTNNYTTGGAIGGSLDQLPFSLDTISSAALAQLSLIDGTHSLGFFTGANLEAQLETTQKDGMGRRMFITATRPLTDAGTVEVSIGWRDTAQSTVAYTAETLVNDIGLCPVDGGGIDARYARAKARIPAGSTWTYAMGIQPEFTPTGTA